MEDTRLEIIRGLIALMIITIEYWALQPYHEPVIARLWLLITQACRRLAWMLGRAALNAEHNYYLAVEAGI